MKSSFNDLGISPPILKAIEEMGFEEPTEVQRLAIPHVLNKEDLVVMSKTGSGKTAVACKLTRHPFIGFEKEKEYFDIAVKNVHHTPMQLKDWMKPNKKPRGRYA